MGAQSSCGALYIAMVLEYAKNNLEVNRDNGGSSNLAVPVSLPEASPWVLEIYIASSRS